MRRVYGTRSDLLAPYTQKLDGRRGATCSLDLDLSARLPEDLGHLLGLGLGDAILDVGRGALDEVLGLLEAEAGVEGTNGLDDVDLLVAEALRTTENSVFSSAAGAAGPAARRGRRRRPERRRRRPTWSRAP